MREAQRPSAERLSVLDRAPRADDWSALLSPPSLARYCDRLERVRLALDIRGCTVLIGRDVDEAVHLITRDDDGGGGRCGGSRRALRESGAIVMTTPRYDRVRVIGMVADDVTTVTVGGRAAYLRNNAFLAEIGPCDEPVVVVTGPTGERAITLDAP